MNTGGKSIALAPVYVVYLVALLSVGCRNTADLDLWERNHLRELDLAIQLFDSSFGRLPETIEELKGYDPSLKIVDAWGRRVVYKPMGDGSYRLMSRGETKTSEDDIVLERKPGEEPVISD